MDTQRTADIIDFLSSGPETFIVASSTSLTAHHWMNWSTSSRVTLVAGSVESVGERSTNS
jgi:hypothetical protein